MPAPPKRGVGSRPDSRWGTVIVMCGRFVSAASPERIAAYFDDVLPTAVVAEPLPDNYNVAPTNDIYALVGTPDHTARLEVFHWGLVPGWAKDRKVGAKMINARVETLAEKPVFQRLLKAKRCIVPMDGFYEWKDAVDGGPTNAKGKPVKQPVFVHHPDGSPLAAAGLWAVWKDPEAPDGQFLHSTTVITTSATRLMEDIHDRMPVLLPHECWAEWLDPTHGDVDALGALLARAGDDDLVLHSVSTAVNNVRNNGPELIEPST
jgi:putative SOS response-associated peptidase YedK